MESFACQLGASLAHSGWAQTGKTTQGGTISVTNAFYIVYVQDIRGSGVGLYTITTGPSHPAGQGLNVLFGGGNPSTSFNTIRSFTTGTDYIQDTRTKSSANRMVALDAFGTAAPLGTTGVRTTYLLPGPTGATNTTPDRLTIIQDVNVNGSTFEDTTVEVTTTIRNNGTATVQIGVRYLWDFQVGLDDGPTFRVNTARCSALTTESEFDNPSFSSYRIEDNDVNPSPPTFDIFGTVTGPSTVTPTPTPPTVLQYVCWPNSIGTAFDYTVNPALDIATAAGTCQSGTGGGDSAVLYFFGRNVGSALSIPPGGQQTVSASLFLSPPLPPPPVTPCITRNARFWFTRAETNESSCVTLQKAISANCEGTLDLGFMNLPTLPRYGNVTDPTEIAAIEALGFYWKSQGSTGEPGGTQSDHSPASTLCKARKNLAVELIAATANVALFGTDPSVCTYPNGGTVTNFPADLLDQARAAAAGVDASQVAYFTVLLRKFNASGVLNDFPSGLVECSSGKSSALRKLSRDPTTQISCPGINNTCDTAETVVFANASDPFAPAKFSRTVSLANLNYLNVTNPMPAPPCGVGGPGAVWKITPDVGKSNRVFTVNTFGSNFATVLAVWTGTCGSGGSNLVAVTNGCTNNVPPFMQSQLSFVTDGVNTFYIVGEGANGAIGKLKIQVTSP